MTSRVRVPVSFAISIENSTWAEPAIRKVPSEDTLPWTSILTTLKKFSPDWNSRTKAPFSETNRPDICPRIPSTFSSPDMSITVVATATPRYSVLREVLIWMSPRPVIWMPSPRRRCRSTLERIAKVRSPSASFRITASVVTRVRPNDLRSRFIDKDSDATSPLRTIRAEPWRSTNPAIVRVPPNAMRRDFDSIIPCRVPVTSPV